MNVAEAITEIVGAHEDSVIFARRPFSPNSEATISFLTSDLGTPDEMTQMGLFYFLERFLVLELLEMMAGKAASQEQVVDFVCHYANNDAYPDWYLELADE